MRVHAHAPLALAAALLAACGSGGGGGSEPSPSHQDPQTDTVLQCARDFLAEYVASTTRTEAIPPVCGATASASSICCPGGVARANCGPLVLDLAVHSGDAPRLEITQPGADTLDVTIRSRVSTAAPVPVTIPVAGACSLTGDTTRGTYPDLALSFVVTRSASPTPHLVISSPALSRVEAADLALSGNLLCDAANSQIPSAIHDYSQTLANALGEQVGAELCGACPCGW